MPIVRQKTATRGSQKWIQLLVNNHLGTANKALRSKIGLPPASKIHWLSPLELDSFAEYYDDAFLEKLGVVLKERSLASYWPARGPHWDALARTDDGEIILIEAKAHIPEMASPPSAASGASLRKIRASLQEVQTYCGAKADVDWTGRLYQYTNRLAHLYLLRTLNGIKAHLVFVYFVGDVDMKGPSTEQEWHGAIALAHSILGLPQKHRLAKYVHECFIDVGQLRSN